MHYLDKNKLKLFLQTFLRVKIEAVKSQTLKDERKSEQLKFLNNNYLNEVFYCQFRQINYCKGYIYVEVVTWRTHL